MKTVLFVCVHNSGRSQMAEAFLNPLAKGKFKAISAGTDPADVVDPTVVEAMREVSIDMSGNKPKALTLETVERTDRVVKMLREYEKMERSQHGRLKSHLDTGVNPVGGFTKDSNR